MQSRLNFQKISPQAFRTIAALETYVKNSGLEPGLLKLVKIRASQINGCGFCIDMHTKEARADGEAEQRIYALDAWRETPFFTDRGRAALTWAEAVTLINESRVPDDVYEETRLRFSEQELVNLSMAIVAINGWNRICIGFRTVPASYDPKTLRI
ncbi:MAG TPA: carboxymuconolactone decarboxylase family protein [Candidatus Koribacter sp.]|jgi:AhpD family alkylhydroperoxidase